MEIKKEDYDEVQRLIKLTRINPSDTKSMERLIRLYLDPKMSICKHCTAQIRMVLKRLQKWNQSITPIIEEIDITEETDITEIKEVEVVVKKKAGRPCTKCKQKK